jgi:hypothetical protein
MKSAFCSGLWSTDIEGNITFKDYYHIEAGRLNEPDWIIHLRKKPSFKFSDFMPVFLQACINADLELITIRTHYKF